MKSQSFGARFGLLVARVRADRGITQKQLADEVFPTADGKPSRTGDISKLENGRTPRPQAATIAKIAGALGIPDAEIEALHDDAANALDGTVERLLAENEALRDQLKLSEALAIGLAYDYAASNPTDFDTAMRELRRAFEVAAEAKDRGLLPGNTDDAVNEVLRRVNDLNERGERAEAAALIAEEEARTEAGLLRLYGSGLDQAVLNRDAEAAAGYEVKKIAIEIPDPTAQFSALLKVQNTWFERGRDKGLNFDMEVAISIARHGLSWATNADQRGAAWGTIGNALQTLGARERGTDRLEEAVAAYRAALEEQTRDRAPLNWARTQMNLGAALQTLAEREPGTDRLEEAVAAYRAALEERTRDRVPMDWAMTQMNLGNALLTLGAREPGTDRLEEAVAAYRAALEERTRDRVPLDWAMTQMNLGNVLATLGAREPGTDRLEEAVAAYRAALEEWTRDRVPLDWALTQNSLGTALQTLGAREPGTDRLDEAIDAFRAALEEWTRDRVPLDWARTQNNLGNALEALGDREPGIDRLKEAVAAFHAALEERTRDRVPLQWAITQHNLAGTHLALFRKTGAPGDLARAKDCALAAAEVFREAGAGHYIAQSESRLAEINAAAGR